MEALKVFSNIKHPIVHTRVDADKDMKSVIAKQR